MSLIVDASVAVKWFSAEDGADRAEALFVTEPDLAAPELILAEVGNAMWKKHREGWLSSAQVAAAIERMPRFLQRLVPIIDLVARASELTSLLDHPIYDCLYLALAEREQSAIVTADGRMLALGQKFATVEIRPL